MTVQSRIKFNPETREIEIEGSEKFVKTYFDKIQGLLAGRTGKTAKNATVGIKGERSSMSKTVISLIQGSKEGLTVAQLKDLTGFDKKQIWAIIYRAEKALKIKKASRGLYVGA